MLCVCVLFCFFGRFLVDAAEFCSGLFEIGSIRQCYVMSARQNNDLFFVIVFQVDLTGCVIFNKIANDPIIRSEILIWFRYPIMQRVRRKKGCSEEKKTTFISDTITITPGERTKNNIHK